MALYSQKAILDWFHRTLGVDSQPAKDEVMTACPECGGNRFYFNTRKLIGICHKASCGYTPSLEDLIDIVGFSPNMDGAFEREEEVEVLPDLVLPGWPIALRVNGELMTTNAFALRYLRDRGLTDDIVLNWGITSDGERIYVPIVDSGVLVNFNSRALPNVSGPKYLYSKGRPTGKYILGWAESRLWDRLSIVENTFVSLWLRSDLRCSTTFGSNISNMQADLIKDAGVRSVALLWDENAEQSAERGIRKLHDRGIPAAYWSILGQPDDYPKDVVADWANRIHIAATLGEPYVDLKGECREARESQAI
jgi:hypothetical protein